MASASRVGTGLLGTFGLALAGLMAYTLAFEGCQGPGSSGRARAVGRRRRSRSSSPIGRDWSDFRRAVAACVRPGAGPACRGGARSRSSWPRPGSGRRVRFAWDGVRGVGEARAGGREAGPGRRPAGRGGRVVDHGPDRRAGRGPPRGRAGRARSCSSPGRRPSGRGGGRRAAAPGDRPGPDVPVLPEQRPAGRLGRRLPDRPRRPEPARPGLHRGRSPRPLLGRPGRRLPPGDPGPGRSGRDRRAGRRPRRAPDGPAARREPPVPSAEEAKLADEIWAAAEDRPRPDDLGRPAAPGRADPAGPRRPSRPGRRGTGRPAGRSRSGSVCGDAIRPGVARGLAGRRAFPIWCASTSSARPPDHGVNDDTQTLAEIVSAVLLAVERSPRARADGRRRPRRPGGARPPGGRPRPRSAALWPSSPTASGGTMARAGPRDPARSVRRGRVRAGRPAALGRGRGRANRRGRAMRLARRARRRSPARLHARPRGTGGHHRAALAALLRVRAGRPGGRVPPADPDRPRRPCTGSSAAGSAWTITWGTPWSTTPSGGGPPPPEDRPRAERSLGRAVAAAGRGALAATTPSSA